MSEHPAESQRQWLLGIVTRVYQDVWAVDVQPVYATSGLLPRVKVVSHFLPEVHTAERQSKVLVGWLDGFQSAPVALPLHNTIMSPADKAALIYWSEHHRYLTRIKASVAAPDTPAEFEIRNATGETLLQIRMLEHDGVIRLDTPSTRIVLKESDQSIEVHCDGTLTATVGGDANVDVGGDATLTADGHVQIEAPTITLKGAVKVDGALTVTSGATVTGNVGVTGNVVATGNVLDGGINTNHHSHS